MHAFAGVAGNVGADQLYERSVVLSQQFKRAATENQPLNNFPITDDLKAITEETNRLVAEIEKHLPVSEITERTDKNEQSPEEAKEKITKLSHLIQENNPEAAVFANQILEAYRFNEIEYLAIAEAAKQLEQFEFDEALIRIKSIEHV